MFETCFKYLYQILKYLSDNNNSEIEKRKKSRQKY